MPHIQQLDPHVADLIAAGEVVERAPANVPFAGDPVPFISSAEVNSACGNASPCGCAFMRAAPPRER